MRRNYIPFGEPGATCPTSQPPTSPIKALKTFQFRGYCTSAGYDRLRQVLANCSQLYNAGLQERRDAWRMARARVTYYDQCKQLTQVRRDLPEWEELALGISRGVLRRVDRAFQSFFRRAKAGQKAGYPRFKPRRRYTTIELAQVSPAMVHLISPTKAAIRVKGLPTIRVKLSRPLPAEGLKARLTFRNGRLEVNLTYSVPVEPLPHSFQAVGIDFGVNQRLTLSTGAGTLSPGHVTPMGMPKKAGVDPQVPLTLSTGDVVTHRAIDRRRERRLQRLVSRARKGSKGRRRKVAMLARERRRNAVRNRNDCHQFTTALVRRFGHIAVEALVITNMTRSAAGTLEEPGTNVAAKRGLNRSIQEQTWGIIREQLRYKAEWAGRAYFEVDPRNTSRTCHQCGSLEPNQEEYRVFRCQSCGLVADRDVNAAINILKRSQGPRLQSPGKGGRRPAGPKPGASAAAARPIGCGQEGGLSPAGS